jgi:hypothetical protein
MEENMNKNIGTKEFIFEHVAERLRKEWAAGNGRIELEFLERCLRQFRALCSDSNKEEVRK